MSGYHPQGKKQHQGTKLQNVDLSLEAWRRETVIGIFKVLRQRSCWQNCAFRKDTRGIALRRRHAQMKGDEDSFSSADLL